MVLNRYPVECFRCKKKVDESFIRELIGKDNKTRYFCTDCHRKSANIAWEGMSESDRPKKELYCERCKYRFMSRSFVCPYCSMDNFVTEGNVSIKDLL